MGAVKKLNYKKILRDLVPINALSEAHIKEVAKKATIEEVRSGRYVFRKGDRDYQSVYLLDGCVDLISDGREIVSTIKAGSADALHPLAHKQPRQLSARAAEKVTVARIDSRLLDVLLTWDESAGYDVVEISSHDDDDWMTRMLQSQAFMQLPPSSIHQLLMRLESINFGAGDVVIQQGDEGDYFYIVKNGRLAVTRQASAQGKDVLLAELGQGAFFGEEALVSDAKRNASVRMVTDGLLMRLSKDDFDELLRETLVHEADFSKAQELVSAGAHWLDVRLPGEFDNCSIRGSSNLPLSALRDQCGDLDSNQTYIVCCDTGRRSSAGAFVLSQRGFNVYVLKNGLMDVPDEALTGRAKEDRTEDGAREADIIPFEAETRSSSEEITAPAGEKGGESQPADTALLDKLTTFESQNNALRQQLERAEKQLAETKAALESAQSRTDQQQSGAQRAERQIDKLNADLQERERQIGEQAQAAQQEVTALKAELDSKKQALETGAQRLSLMQGANKSLQEEVARLGQSLAELQASGDSREGELRTELEQREQQLEEEQKRRQSLEGQVGQLEESRTALQEELDAVRERTSIDQNKTVELEGQVAAHEQKLQGLESSLAEAVTREESLQSQLRELEERRVRELEDSQAGASAQQVELNERIQALQSQLDERTSLLERQQAEREELAQKLNDAQLSMQERGESERQMAERLQRAEGGSDEVKKELDQARAEGDELRKQLDEVKQRLGTAEKRSSELAERLASAEKEHVSDISSLRDALARAQDERENVTREQTRLLGALRKAERDLERGRQDHETEVHRLQRELKEAAGESSRALAAELDALQEKIEESTKQRDDLEIQLGERSAQLENEQAQVEKLGQQLKLAQENSRQAEQQLIETNQVATEELRTSFQAEQQALGDQLEAVTAERNQNQEQLTVLNHELQELREAVQQAQGDQAANKRNVQALQDAERQVQSLRQTVQQLEQARDEASQSYKQAQREVDELRAEAEVSRGLVDMQAPHSNGDEALHAELVETRKNLDVAVRLRLQAEGKAAELQQRVERLQGELSHAPSPDPAPEQGLQTSARTDNGTFATAGREPQAKLKQYTASASVSSSGSPEQATRFESGVAVEPFETGKRSAWRAKLVVLLIIGMAAAAAYWWYIHAPSDDNPQMPVDMHTGVVDPMRLTKGPTGDPTAGSAADLQVKEGILEAGEKPRSLPSFVKGMGEIPLSAGGDVSADSEVSESNKAVATQAVGGLEQQPALPSAPVQPLRTFSEALSSGGTAPTVVEFGAQSFEMGSSAASANFAERPRRRVKLKRFAIARTEVTFAQYDQFAEATGRARPRSGGWGRGNRPVINVSWSDAVAYTRWLSEQTGNPYRLPTEAEWEFAVRAGTDSRFWWGNEVGESRANCFDCGGVWSGKQTAPVGSYSASTFGLHDMAGNVMEWVQDCYKPGYADAPDSGSAVEFSGCGQRVVRGGGYDSPADLLRSASRGQRPEGAKLDNLGFRVVRDF